MKARWNYVNTLLTWAIASAGFFYTQWRHTTPLQTAAVLVGCFAVALLANGGIDALRTRRNRP
jgi:hypothetical protein